MLVLSVSGNPDASWRFVDNQDDPGLDYTFPSDTSLTLASGKYLLLVKDLDAFEDVFGVPSGPDLQTTLEWGIGNGSLSNGGEKLELQKPLPSDLSYYIRVDRVNYDDEAPWPTEPDGTGSALRRLSSLPAASGKDAANWTAQTPTPGW